MLDTGVQGITDNNFNMTKEEILTNIKQANSKRIFFIAKALKMGVSIKKIYELSGIDPWFLHRLKVIVEAEKKIFINKGRFLHSLRSVGMTKLDSNVIPSDFILTEESRDLLLNLKQLGFSDKKIGQITGSSELEIRNIRIRNKIIPSVFQIDTLAGEFPARTNYL